MVISITETFVKLLDMNFKYQFSLYSSGNN